MRFLLTISTIISLTLTACIDEIDVPLSNDSVLVIEGLITDELGPHQVKISHSYSFNENPVFAPIDPLVFGATVEISDDNGNTIQLTEGRNGSYFTPPTFTGIAGSSYTLSVTLNNGEVYFSRPERLLPVGATINEVCFENTVREVSSAEATVEEREVLFTVNFTDQIESNDFYRWGYQSVHEIEAPLADSTPPCPPPDETSPPCSDPVKTCWVHTFDTEFLKVESDELYNGKTTEGYEIYSTPADRKFNITYAANIELYSLTESAYKYWHALSSQLNNNGTIFETPNHQIRGNIVAQNDPDQLVLGFFGASAKSTARTILNDIDVPGNAGPIDCTPGPNGNIPAACTDCRKLPASSVKPFYWP